MLHDRKKPDYSKTKLYFIKIGNEYYYGHTTTSLNIRKSKHVYDFNQMKNLNKKLFKAIRESKLDWADIQLVLVENFPCESFEQACDREAYWIQKYGKLNKNMPNRCHKDSVIEWTNKNFEKMKAFRKAYHAKHRDKILERKRKYYMENKGGKIAEYYQKNKDRITRKNKEYVMRNKAKIAERLRKYRENNADKIKAQRKANSEVLKDKAYTYNHTIVSCPVCDKQMVRGSLSRHKKTIHKDLDMTGNSPATTS